MPRAHGRSLNNSRADTLTELLIEPCLGNNLSNSSCQGFAELAAEMIDNFFGFDACHSGIMPTISTFIQRINTQAARHVGMLGNIGSAEGAAAATAATFSLSCVVLVALVAAFPEVEGT